MKFRKKPVVIEAMQIPETNTDEFKVFCLAANTEQRDRIVGYNNKGKLKLWVSSLEGVLEGMHPDWLVIGTRNEPYIVEGDIFPDIYEVAE